MKTIEELERAVSELEDTLGDYVELLENVKKERDDYKIALEEIVDICGKLV